MHKKLVAFIGAIGAGKSTAASIFTAGNQFKRISFADPLKSMLNGLGLSYEDLYGTEKETPSLLLSGKTPRFAMQTLGTEWGRDIISQELWVNAWLHRVSCNVEAGTVVDDMRFANEYSAVRSLGGIVVKIVRQDKDSNNARTDDAHASEAAFENFNYDYIITNRMDRSFEPLVKKVRLEIVNRT